MAIADVLTHELVFRWDEARKKLVVLDGEKSLRMVAEIDYETLDRMNWPEASKFVGEFVTLLMPALRQRYSDEFADTREESDRDGE